MRAPREYRHRGGGARGAQRLNTLLVSVNTLVMNRSLYPKLPFDPVKDLVPVSLTSWGQLLLVANPNAGFKPAAELVAAAKARPGAINYASPGVGTPHHLSMELFKATAESSSPISPTAARRRPSPTCWAARSRWRSCPSTWRCRM